MRKQYLILLGFAFLMCSLHAQESTSITDLYEKGKAKQAEGLFEEANDFFTEAVKLCPQNLDPSSSKGELCINIHFNIGVCANKHQSFDSAILAFTRVIGYNPLDHESYALRGDVWLKKGETEKGIADIQQALRIIISDWDNIDDYYRLSYTHNLAMAHWDVNEIPSALMYMNTVIEIDNQKAYREKRAKMLYLVGDIATLEQELNSLEKEGPLNENLNFEKGAVLMYRTQYNEALPYFKEVKVEENIPDAIRNLTLCYIQLNQINLAKNQIGQLEAIQHDPAELEWMKSQIFAREGKWDQALVAVDSASVLPNRIQEFLSIQKANIHYRKGEFKKVIQACATVPQEHSLHLEARTLAALAHLDLSQFKEAGEIFTIEQGLHPQHPLLQGRLAWYIFRTGEKEKAALLLEKLANDYPNSAEINYYSAEANFQIERYTHQECHALLDAAMQIHPSMEEMYTLKARLLYGQNRIEEAQRFIDIAEEMGITHAYSSYNAASIYLGHEKPDMALRHSSRAMEIAPYELAFQKQQGISFFNVGQWFQAITFLNKGIEADPNDGELIKARALSYKMTGMSDLGDSDLAQVEHLNQFETKGTEAQTDLDFVEAYIHYATLFMHNVSNDDNYENALSLLDNALVEALKIKIPNGQLAKVYNEIGMLHWTKGKLQLALESFNLGIAKDPTPEIYTSRARVQFELKRFVEMEKDMEMAAKLKKD